MVEEAGLSTELAVARELATMRKEMMDGASGIILVGGRTFEDSGGSKTGMTEELFAFREANPEGTIIVVSGFGGNTSEEDFLAMAQLKGAIIVTATDPEAASDEVLGYLN